MFTDTLHTTRDEQAAPMFGPYLDGLTFLSKTDVHLSLAPNAHAAFLSCLRKAMMHFGDWDGDPTTLVASLHGVMEPVIKDEGNRDMIFTVLQKTEIAVEDALSTAVSVKRIADLYLVIVANRLWPEFVRGTTHEPRRSVGQ